MQNKSKAWADSMTRKSRSYERIEKILKDKRKKK